MGEDTIKELIGVAIGQASMCWSNPEGAGVFDSDKAGGIAEDLLADIKKKFVNLLDEE